MIYAPYVGGVLYAAYVGGVLSLFMFLLLLHRMTWSNEFKRERELKRGNRYVYGYKDVIIGTIVAAFVPILSAILIANYH
jgi:hypothetical protein